MKKVKEYQTFKTSMLLCLLLVMLFSSLLPSYAFADVTKKDFQVIARSIGFLNNLPKGEETFTIIYDPAISSSQDEARALKEMFSKKKSIKGLKIRTQFVPIQHIAEIGAPKFIFVTSNLGPHHGHINQVAQRHNSLSITLDRSCVESGNCILYINTEKRVDITVNKSAAERANIQFAPVFMVMVTTL